jgi:23S rRNA (guanine2445-N2)-methyltransferase / 23S rRNA (guanine2069-N7)-methyltransferase
VVSRELRGLGYESRALRPGWLAFEGDESAIARSNLWLRASDRVLLQMASFPAADFEALFEGARAVAWERILPRNARFPVRGRSVRSALASVPACQSIVKKAIVERLKQAYRVENLPEDGPAFPVEIALLKDEAILVLDTSGPGLHKRGYRPESGEAPLKETLAAGLVLLSHWNRDRPFLDPFCGTGTIAIEAALIGRNRAPGSKRSFAAESWPAVPPEAWRRARAEARDLERPPLPEPLEASDRDEKVLALARRSASKASVGKDVRFTHRDFQDLSSEREYGCLIANPPYGERIGDEGDVRLLYRAMPGVFRRLPTWSFFILTARRDLEKVVGQTADRRRKLYNGDVECTYFQFLGPRPGEPSARAQGKRSESWPPSAASAASGGQPPERRARAAQKSEKRWGWGGSAPIDHRSKPDDRARRQAEMFANRLRKKAHHLRKWTTRRGTNVYRLYDRDIKEVPLAVDRYGDYLRLIPSKDRLQSRTPAEQEDWLDLMARTASETLGVPLENVVIAGRPAPERRILIKEDGVEQEVTLSGSEEVDFHPRLRVLRRWLRTEPAPVVPTFEEVPRDSRVVYVVSRLPRWKLDSEALSGWKIEDVTEKSLPEDFRSKKGLRIWKLTRAV